MDPHNRGELELALQGLAFRENLVGLMDEMNLPASNDLPTRLYSIPIRLHQDFNNLYEDNHTGFREMIQALQTIVQENCGPFFGPFPILFAPENSRGRGATGGNRPNFSFGGPRAN